MASKTFFGTPQNTMIVLELTRNNKDGTQETISEVLGSVQSFAYQVRRAKAPIYVIGSAEPITISKGPRSVAGTMQGVILADKFFAKLIEYFWATKDASLVSNNGIPRVQGGAEIEDIYGSIDNFLNKFVTPYIRAISGNDNLSASSADLTVTKTIDAFGTDVTLDWLSIPPLYLDEIPAMQLKLVTPIEVQEDAGKTKVKVEEVTFYGLEFLNNDFAIQAGAEALIESVNFIQRGVSKKIDIIEK